VKATVKLELAEAATPNVPLYGSLEGAAVVNVIVWLAGLTVWFTEPELPPWLLSPEYVAPTVSDPPPRLLVVHDATPGYAPDNVLAAHPVFALQVTVPLGCIGCMFFLPALRPFTSPVSLVIVAVNVTDPPYVEGFRPELTLVVEAFDVIVKLSVSGLLDAE